MLKIAICEDNPLTLESLISMAEQSGIDSEIDSFESGTSLLNYLTKSAAKYQVYFLDIEMPGDTGIETASKIRKQDRDALIIFVTDHKEYVYEVFEVLPFRFLSKPVDPEKMHQVLKDAQEHLKRFSQIYFFHIGHEHFQEPYQNILYFEGAGRKIKLHTFHQDYEHYGRISNVPNEVDSGVFVQIHGSFIINMEYIRAIRSEEAVLQNGISLPISDKYRTKLKNAHLNFIKQRGGK